MNLPRLHGFLTALAVGPALVPPSEWLAAVWGEEGPLFDSWEEAERISGLLFRLYNSISRTLEEAPGTFSPLLYEVEGGHGKARRSAEEWCAGFSQGVGFQSDDWRPLIEDEDAMVLLTPIIAFSSAEAMAGLLEKKKPEVNRETLISFISPAVVAIHEYWKPQRKKWAAELSHDASPARRDAKVGRNDPCPCGSGRKYKKCCGAKAS